jgi:hypothetical protein
LRKQSRQLAKERSEIQKRKDSAIAASTAFHAARSNASHTDSRRHRRHGSRVENLKHSDRRNLSRNDSSFLSIDEQGNIIPKTPEAALVAAQTYLYTMWPSPRYPREHMHRAALQGLRLVGNKLTAKDEEAYLNKGTHKPRSPCRHNGPRHRSSSRRYRSSSPKYYKSPRHGGTRRSRTPTKAYDYEDDEKRWEHRALLAEFAPHQYRKVSNYPMISKNMMDPRSHNYGSQIICRQSKYLEDQRKQ